MTTLGWIAVIAFIWMAVDCLIIFFFMGAYYNDRKERGE